jgi:two-component system OmpR family sensor kinase
MGRFLADTVHELRVPLTVLTGTAQVLLGHRNLEQAEVDSALVAIHEEASRLSRLVDDLAHLARGNSDRDLDLRAVALAPFLGEFVDKYGRAWPERLIAVDCAALDGAQAQADSDALTRILINLVDNAARYSAPGTPILIRGAVEEHAVLIEVHDEGPGLSAEDSKRAFERSYRGRRARSGSSTGSGLGLAIVHALVRQSQGEIYLDTGPGRGTTITVALPRLTDVGR